MTDREKRMRTGVFEIAIRLSSLLYKEINKDYFEEVVKELFDKYEFMEGYNLHISYRFENFITVFVDRYNSKCVQCYIEEIGQDEFKIKNISTK